MFHTLNIFSCFFQFAGNFSFSRRIVGGAAIKIEIAPFQASLQNSKGHKCGCTIIDTSFVLTSAHCLDNEPIRKLVVKAGTELLNKGGYTLKVCSAVIHSKYKKEVYDYDIALLKLCKRFIFSSKISSVTIPIFNEAIIDGAVVVTSGWGVREEGSTIVNNQLQNIFLTVINQTVCREKYQGLEKITGRMVCATCQQGKVCDACQGDSGGPLSSDNKLIGIVTFGYGCARKGYPGVYTRISKFTKWIKTSLKL